MNHCTGCHVHETSSKDGSVLNENARSLRIKLKIHLESVRGGARFFEGLTLCRYAGDSLAKSPLTF